MSTGSTVSLGNLQRIDWGHPVVPPIVASLLLAVFGFLVAVFCFLNLLLGNHSASNGGQCLFYFVAPVVGIVVIFIVHITDKRPPRVSPSYRAVKMEDGIISAATPGPGRGGVQANKRVFLAIIPVLGAITVALIQYPPSQHRSDIPSTIRFAGTVEDFITNEPIGHAEITLVGLSGDWSTDDSGNFVVDVSVNGASVRDVRVRVSKPGYNTYDHTLPLGPGQIIQLKKP